MPTDVLRRSVKSNYKTELCDEFEQNGICKFRARCTYAHGEAELRKKLSPRFKQKLCVKYHHGICPYGKRCAFAHGENPRLLSVIPQFTADEARMRWILALLAGSEKSDPDTLDFINDSRFLTWVSVH